MEGPDGPSMGTPIYYVGLACSSCSRCSPLEHREPVEPGAPAKTSSWPLSRIMGHVPRTMTMRSDSLNIKPRHKAEVGCVAGPAQ